MSMTVQKTWNLFKYMNAQESDRSAGYIIVPFALEELMPNHNDQ